MSEKTSPDTVPGLGFKDKTKALETLKNLEGRDPDYQKLAIKGLIGRAKRTLTLTKAEDKLQNIKDAMDVFDDWLKNFDKMDLGKENRSYLPLATVQVLLPLKKQFQVECKEAEDFLAAYKSVDGDYKHLRTVTSGEDLPTWDIIRNSNLKRLIKAIDEDEPDMWENDLPTKRHLELIIWAYSPDASKIKKNLSKLEEKLGSYDDDENEISDDAKDEMDSDSDSHEDAKGLKRKSGSSSDEETPKKKSKN